MACDRSEMHITYVRMQWLGSNGSGLPASILANAPFAQHHVRAVAGLASSDLQL